MKPGLAVLPMDVWADVFVYPWINRQELAQIVDQFKERAFAEKLQMFLHDPQCGKHSLRYLWISSKPPPECRASLAVTHCGDYFGPNYTDCDFPKCEMPENIKTFKRLEIGHFDDQVLDFLGQIKPLFTNVLFHIGSVQSAENLRILFAHLLPMLGGIRAIFCDKNSVDVLEQHFPGALAHVKELSLSPSAYIGYIPPYLKWLCAPQDFHQHGPRFLRTRVYSTTIAAMVKAVRKQFVAATKPSAFVVILEFYPGEEHNRAEKLQIENPTTGEQLTIRNAIIGEPMFGSNIHYVEIMRHPIGADAKMREWIEKRDYEKHGGPEQRISIRNWPPLTIGQITKKAGPMMDHGNNQPADDDQDEAGPSTAKKMKKSLGFHILKC